MESSEEEGIIEELAKRVMKHQMARPRLFPDPRDASPLDMAAEAEAWLKHTMYIWYTLNGIRDGPRNGQEVIDVNCYCGRYVRGIVFKLYYEEYRSLAKLISNEKLEGISASESCDIVDKFRDWFIWNFGEFGKESCDYVSENNAISQLEDMSITGVQASNVVNRDSFRKCQKVCLFEWIA
eukprot:Nk52_evm6s462 gene=Nk52_evmTU6s462